MAEENVRGRIPLETNPGNRRPGFQPVHDSTGNEDYVRTSPENPLPTKDADVGARLDAIESKLDSVIENGAINTQLSGSIVEEVLYENQQLLAGATFTSGDINLENINKFGIGIRSSSSKSYYLELTWRANNNDFIGYRLDKFENKYEGILTGIMEPKSSKVRLDITNDSDSDRTFDIFLYKK